MCQCYYPGCLQRRAACGVRSRMFMHAKWTEAGTVAASQGQRLRPAPRCPAHLAPLLVLLLQACQDDGDGDRGVAAQQPHHLVALVACREERSPRRERERAGMVSGSLRRAPWVRFRSGRVAAPPAPGARRPPLAAACPQLVKVQYPLQYPCSTIVVPPQYPGCSTHRRCAGWRPSGRRAARPPAAASAACRRPRAAPPERAPAAAGRGGGGVRALHRGVLGKE